MAKLPPAIQQQSDALEALYAQPSADEGQAQPAQADSAPSSAPVVAPDPADAPQPAAGSGEAVPLTAVTTAGSTANDAAPQPAPTPAREESQHSPQADRPKPDNWEQRYKTLQGMHNQNVGDLRRRLDQASSENAALMQRIAALEATGKPTTPTVDPKYVEEFGGDMVAMVQAIVESNLSRKDAAFDSRIDNLNRQVATAAQETVKTADELFLERLAVRVPDVMTVNQDQAFLDWLGEPDPIYGVPRQAALDTASQARDVERTARIFETYKGLTASAAQGGGAPAPAPAPAPALAGTDPQLAKQVAPRAGVSAPVVAHGQAQAQIISSEDVARFYDDVRRGVYRGRDDEMSRREQELNNALANGRIRV